MKQDYGGTPPFTISTSLKLKTRQPVKRSKDRICIYLYKQQTICITISIIIVIKDIERVFTQAAFVVDHEKCTEERNQESRNKSCVVALWDIRLLIQPF